MTRVKRCLAPSGAPISAVDLWQWLVTSVAAGDAEAQLKAQLASMFGVDHVVLAGTGRAALTLLLRAMRRLAPAGRAEVVVPAYTCYSVAASILKAGLTPRIVDVSPDTLDFAPGALEREDFSRVLAVVATSLYGLPANLPAWDALARGRGVFLVDDAAQAMGATVGGRPCGTWGDAGLLSFDKGKNVSAIDGGAVLTRSDALAEALQREANGLLDVPAIMSCVHVAKATAYWALLRPWLYGIPASLPQLGLGRTVFDTTYPLHRMDQVLASLAVVMLRRLEEFTAARRATAAALAEALSDAPGVRVVPPIANAVPAYLRLAVIADDSARRDDLLHRLVSQGLGATASYPQALISVPEVQKLARPDGSPTPGALAVAGRILTLPTHPYVTGADIARIAACFHAGAPDLCAA